MTVCKTCNGLGKIKLMPFGYICTCAECKGTGETRDYMTNEEWFNGLATEEKAEFSMRVFKNCTWCLDGGSPQECPFNEFSEHCPAESKENMMKWLKKPHEE